MARTFTDFIVLALDRIKDQRGLQFDKQLADIIRKKPGMSTFADGTIAKWRRGETKATLDNTNLLLGLLDPPLQIGDCLYFPDEVSFLKVVEKMAETEIAKRLSYPPAGKGGDTSRQVRVR